MIIINKGIFLEMGMLKLFLMFGVCTALTGCGVLAAPCRIASAVIKMVPVVGGVAALPTDGCAAVID
jgi:hypothetical protein